MRKWQGGLFFAVVLVLGIVLVQQLLSRGEGTPVAREDGGGSIAPSEAETKGTGARLAEGPVVGAVAPDFALQGLDGHTYRLSDRMGEIPVVINFWASWCPPCKTEAPDLVQLYSKYHGKVEIFAVNLTMSDTVEDAKKFVEQYGYQFPVLLDDKGEVGLQYQAYSIPTSYFIDRTGRIRNKMIGITTPDRLEQMFVDLMKS